MKVAIGVTRFNGHIGLVSVASPRRLQAARNAFDTAVVGHHASGRCPIGIVGEGGLQLGNALVLRSSGMTLHEINTLRHRRCRNGRTTNRCRSAGDHGCRPSGDAMPTSAKAS